MEKNMILTDHCKVRMRQRGVPEKVIYLIRKYGKSINTHNDKKFFCNKRILNNLYKQKETRSYIKDFYKHLLSTAIICNGDMCITVMKIDENRRMRWN